MLKLNNQSYTKKGIALRLLVGLVLAWSSLCFGNSLNHKCELGIKWFEHYAPFVIAASLIIVVFCVRRFWLSILVGVLLFLAFNFAVVPIYGKWVHDPNSKYFAGQREKRDQKFKEIEAKIDALAAESLKNETEQIAPADSARAFSPQSRQ